MKPFFSVVISVFNKEKFVKEAIESVVNQTYSDFEIIVIDDGSTDNSLDIIKSIKFQNLKIFTKENKGVSSARNLGINEAQGKFIALLDGDDLWKPEFLETISLTISRFPGQKVFTSALAHLYDNKIVPVTYNFESKVDVSLLDYFENSLEHQILTSSSIVFNKAIVETVGMFDESIRSGEDIDYWIRIGFHYQIVFIHKILVLYRYYEDSLSNTSFDLSLKPKYDGYGEIEANEPRIKKYIDKNRYSLALMSKLYGDDQSYKFYRDRIDLKSLNLRRRLLLDSPAWVLKLLLEIKSIGGKKLYYRPLKSKKS